MALGLLLAFLPFFSIVHLYQVFLNGSETSETLLQSELYVAKLSLKCRYLFGNFCKFLAPKTKTVNKNIVMKVNFLKKTVNIQYTSPANRTIGKTALIEH